MKISKIKVKNFRLLKDFFIDLEEDLSLVLGKNNCGKTSLLVILDKFLNNKSFSFNDFSIDFKSSLESFLEHPPTVDDDNFPFLGINLKIFIEYDDTDNLSNIGDKVIMDLDPDNNFVVLGFEYSLTKENYFSLKRNFEEEKEKNINSQEDIYSFLKSNYKEYFKISKRSILYDTEHEREDDEIYIDLLKENVQIDKIINFKWVNAKRSVSNKDKERSLSSQSAAIYKKMENKKMNPDIINEFKNALTETDKELEVIYEDIFKEVIDDVRKFGGTKEDETSIKITSTLQRQELLEDNTTVVYGTESEGIQLPENYNGLGYMNLISMIFEIKIILHDFQKDKSTTPSDINLLFIEEPEVHTHPQMQRVFIKNIKSLLADGIQVDGGKNRELQTIISTHSSHIVSESEFEDIKYFKRNKNGVISNNLKDLKNEYDSDGVYYKFLKQYLTLHRADLFFADKVILIEGDTERILLPAMMKKIDDEDELAELTCLSNKSLPLLSQNISIVEVGAYSQVFEKLIDFIGVKSLIITDIDSIKAISDKDDNGDIKKNEDGTDKMKTLACRVSEGERTSNASLKFFYGNQFSLIDFINMPCKEKLIKKDTVTKKWIKDDEGHVLFVYQTEETNNYNEKYHGRSFEDSFFHINKDFLREKSLGDGGVINNDNFPNITQKVLRNYLSDAIDAYKMAEGVKKKPSFAMEILLNSENKTIEFSQISTKEKVKIDQEFSNWEVPAYIKEGLAWLKAD